jgi:hypothetical protein
MRKIHCEACGVILYGSAAALTRSGLPVCGCGERMTVPNLRDRAAVEWDALEIELRSYGPLAFNDAMRELGHLAMVEPLKDTSRKGGAEQKRCGWEGGYCSVYVASRYCTEHTPGGLDAHYSDRRGA